MQSKIRSSSCREVAFEIKSLPARDSSVDEETKPRFLWFSGGLTSSRMIHDSSSLRRSSLSRTTSSHYCDLEIGDEDDDEEFDVFVERLEEGSKEGDKEHHKMVAVQTLAAVNNPSIKKPPPPANTKKHKSRLWIMLLDQGLFTIYKRLFAICLTLNIIALVLAATGHFPYARNKPALFSIGNILALTLSRNEIFLRGVFWLVLALLGRSWVPLAVKNFATSILQSVGGIHSSCGISSLAWLVYALVLTLKDRENTSTAIIAVASTILALICLTSLAAFPIFRHLHHNVFERIHRFAGWTALALLWVFIVLTISYDPQTKSYSKHIGARLIKQQEFWFTLVITVLIIIPWVTVRRVPVSVSAPSNHAAIIKFEGGVKAGMLGRISPSPLSEWHGFGIISDGKTQHMMIAGAVGDYTKSLVSNPPSHLWVRKVHFIRLPYLVNMYEKILVVATGSGIAVFLSLLLQQGRADIYLIWITKGVEQNFGKEIKEMVEKHPKEKSIVHDTAIHGRPNVSQLSIDAAKKWGVQVVFVTSNPEGSRDVVNACKGAGIAAFAPIWDS